MQRELARPPPDGHIPARFSGVNYQETGKPGWSHLWEATMALTFEPERVVYDPSEGLMRFFAADGAAIVGCAISKAALAALGRRRTGRSACDGDHIPSASGTIQEITESKYRGRRLEDGGCVVVRLADVTAQLPQHRSLAIAAS
jgi:hypothetical protein